MLPNKPKKQNFWIKFWLFAFTDGRINIILLLD